MTKPKVQVGDKVKVAFDNPPDEWGTVESIYRANPNYYRRALIRFPDGSSEVLPLSRLEVITDTSILPEQYR